MRLIVSLVVLILFSGWFACHYEVPGRDTVSANGPDELAYRLLRTEDKTTRAANVRLSGWVRTANGWENTSSWFPQSQEVFRPSLHPFVVGLLQLLLSVMALVAFPYRTKARDPVRSGSSEAAHLQPPAPIYSRSKRSRERESVALRDSSGC